MRVIKTVILLILISYFSVLAGQEHTHGQDEIHSFKLSTDIVKQLGIKWQTIQKKKIEIKKRYPAVVKDDLNLSQVIYSPVEGLIEKLYIQEGDFVKAGQKVALINSPLIKQLIAKIKMTKVEVDNAKAVFERQKMLYEKELISYGQYLEAKIKLDTALSKLKALEETLKSYGTIKNGYLVLKSSISGFVDKQNVVLGESVDINRQLFKIHKLKKLWVVAFVPVEDTLLFGKNDIVQIISPLGKTSGKVSFISSSVDPKTKRNQVRILADNKNLTLKPNMFVDVFISKTSPKGIYIPTKAVVIKDGNFFVFVKENNIVHLREIKIDGKIGNYYKVLDGVKEGETIITEGTTYLKSKFLAEAEGH